MTEGDFRMPAFQGDEPCVDQWHVFYGDGPETREGKAEREALAVMLCQRGCRMIDACAVWGIHHERHGVWGGLSETDRGAIRAAYNVRLEVPEPLADYDKTIIRTRAARERATRGGIVT